MLELRTTSMTRAERQIVSPVKHHSHSSADDCVKTWFRSVHWLHNGNARWPVESGEELKSQARTLILRECSKNSVLEEWNVEANRFQLDLSSVGWWNTGRRNEHSLV